MNDHLPECPWPEKPCGPSHEPMHDRQPLFCVACLTECDCERLRACEKRVLDAAREAVMALDTGRDIRFSVDVRADALAAIDALRLPAEP